MLCLITIVVLIGSWLGFLEGLFSRPRANAAHNRY
jgi:hypothetical protein